MTELIYKAFVIQYNRAINVAIIKAIIMFIYNFLVEDFQMLLWKIMVRQILINQNVY